MELLFLKTGKSITSDFNDQVDREKGIISDVSVMLSNREATGHGFFIDETAIDQVVDLGQATKDVGVKVRFSHPDMCFRTEGSTVARMKNFRKVDLSDGSFGAIADMHLLEAAKDLPQLGNVHKHILSMAEEAPEFFGMSIAFTMGTSFRVDSADHPDLDEDDPFLMPHIRVKELHAADVVDEGAATTGFFNNPKWAAKISQNFLKHNKELASTILKPLVQELIEEQIKLNQNNNNNTVMKTKKIKLSASQRLSILTSGSIELSQGQFDKADDVENEEENNEENSEEENSENKEEENSSEENQEENSEENNEEENSGSEEENNEEENSEELSAEQKEIAKLKAENEKLSSRNAALENGGGTDTDSGVDPITGESKLSGNALASQKNAEAFHND